MGPADTPAMWHFLGHVQRNKVRSLAAVVGLWQGVDRLAAGAEIAARAPGAKLLVQLNVSDEPARNGCPPDDVPALVGELRALGLDVAGLMAMGPPGPPERARPGFRRLVAMADDLGLAVRSIGMTADLEVAVEEGTTMVRIGRGLFGPRPERPDLRR
jgi:PLP dependent protein